MPSMSELIALIGQPLDAPAVATFRRSHALTRFKLDDPYETDRWLLSKEEGYSIQHSKGPAGRRIVTIHLFTTPRDGYSAFQGELIQGLRPTDGRAQVRRRLGEPTRSGAVGTDPILHHDRYDSEQVCIHLEYGPRARGIRMITLMAPDVAP